MRTAVPAAILIVALAISFVLDAQKVGAFPQSTTRDHYFFAGREFGEMATADVNGDSHLDFILLETNLSSGVSGFSVYEYSLLGQYELTASIRYMTIYEHMIVDDINGDGKVDVALLTSGLISQVQVHIYFQGPMGFTGMSPDVVLFTPGAIDISSGSLIGFGAGHDLVVVYPNSVKVYDFLGPPTYFDAAISQTLANSFGFAKALVSDVDGDGAPDLILFSANRFTIFFSNAGNIDPSCAINCREYQLPVIQTGNVSLTVADVGSDGRNDMIFAVSNDALYSGSVIVLTASGNPRLPDFTVTFMDSRDSTNRFAVADFNRDGRNDIAVVLYTAGNVGIMFQRSDGTFRNLFDLQLTGTAYSGIDEYIVAGDFAGGSYFEDGYQDIAVRARTSDRSAISIFHQEDQPVAFTRPIPYQCPDDCFYFNQGSDGGNLIDLEDYFEDDHGPIDYSIVYQERPADLQARFGADGHHLNFSAAPGWYGMAAFRVAANDRYPGHQPIESNDFVVMVNAAPTISSVPPVQVRLGNEYKYLPTVDDPFPTGDRQTFYLVEGPSDASVDANSGLMLWTPAAAGNFTMSIKAVDSYGASSPLQTFTITVLPEIPNPPPGTINIPVPAEAVNLTVIGVSIVAIIMIALAAAMNENAKYALLMLVMPLYSKIKREKVLDHFIRGQIFGYIMANPGEHYNSIKQALDITNGSLAHHLKTLERESFVKSKRFGLYRRFYPWAMRVPEDGYFQLNEIQKNILDLCRNQPGVSQKELAASLNLTPPTINYHISILAEHGYIQVVRRGRRTQIYTLREGKVGEH